MEKRGSTRGQPMDVCGLDSPRRVTLVAGTGSGGGSFTLKLLISV
jgi:hypothetical protein